MPYAAAFDLALILIQKINDMAKSGQMTPAQQKVAIDRVHSMVLAAITTGPEWEVVK